MLFWHVPAPNEALLISGSKRDKEATQFRIVTGHGSFVLPVKQRARMLSLALREAEIVEECITNQGIRLNVRAVAAFKVGDDQASIANAARRFLSEQDRMEVLVGRVFAGHRRADGRADHQGTGPGRPGGEGRQPQRDGEARHRGGRA
jgi:flotillin